jgi:glycosyltransferase involved in cell wall biosynthesis
LKEILLIEELRRKYKRINPDLILHYTHKPNIFGTIAAQICGYKSISVITGLGYSFINKGLIHKITKLLYKLTSHHNSAVIFENEDDKNLFIKEGMTLPEKAISVKGCGVDLSFYHKFPNGEVHKEIVFTFIGRLLKDKGVREFVKAAHKVKQQFYNTKFIILGDFDQENPSTIDREELLTWINTETIDYKGFVDDVRPYIAQSDCIVLPSYREGLPRILLEGMAMSKPIITTDTAGCRETVEDGKNGFLVKVKDHESLIMGMQKFLALSDEQQKEMGAYGNRKVATEFEASIIAKQLYDIIINKINR